MSRPRALVLRALGLGDLLAGVPALRALRQALPDHELLLAAPPVLGPLVDLVGAVDRLVPADELEPVPWCGPRPEVAIDLHGNGPASKRVLEALRPGRLIAFAGPGADGAHVPGPRWDAEEHERARWCRLVAWGFGGRHDPDDVAIRRPSRGSGSGGPGGPGGPGAAIVHPGAASPSRRWPGDRFGTVARALAADGQRVLVTGSEGERPLAVQVARAAGLPPGAVVAGRTDLVGLAALVADAALVVCGDTGIGHVASAYATPSVQLFGPTPPRRWGPPRTGPHTVLWHGTPDDPPGDPHGERPDPVLLRTGAAEVVEAALLRLRVAGPRSR